MRPSRSPSRRKGQSLVEFALVMPILMFLLLGFGEAAFLFADRHAAQNAADVLADAAAARMAVEPGESWQAGWTQLVSDEAVNANCDLQSHTVTFPDVTHNVGDRVRVFLRCAYNAKITNGLWPGLVFEVQSTSIVRS